MSPASERRNPYVILGLPFGSAAEDARRALPNVLRRVRTSDDLVYGIEDVTWALHEIELATEDPRRSTEMYRIPANPEALRAPETGEEQLFKPVPRPPIVPLEPLEEAMSHQWHLAVLEQIAATVEAECARIDLPPDYGGM